MKRLKVAVGTISKQKINYLEEVLNTLSVKYKLYSTEVTSGVSEQPITISETKKGSINRASKAITLIDKSDIGVGIEIGYHKDKKLGYQIFCAVTIVDNLGHRITTESHKFLLPKYHQEILGSNLQLGHNLDGFTKSKQSKYKKHLHEIIRLRKPFIENALQNAFLLYLNKEYF